MDDSGGHSVITSVLESGRGEQSGESEGDVTSEDMHDDMGHELHLLLGALKMEEEMP